MDGEQELSAAASNVSYRRAYLGMADDLSRGKPLSEAMRLRSGLFPKFMVRMCRVGEDTGTLGPVLEKLTVFYGDRIDAKLQAASSLMVPAFTLLIGGMV